MAIGQTRVNGGAQPTELVGRELDWVLVGHANLHVTYTNVDSDFEIVIRTLENYGTVTIVGTPATDYARFVMEGLNANAAVLDTALTAAVGGNPNVAVSTGLSGDTFAS
jgi:hypothetical protein